MGYLPDIAAILTTQELLAVGYLPDIAEYSGIVSSGIST